jgi:hypothetical protein
MSASRRYLEVSVKAQRYRRSPDEPYAPRSEWRFVPGNEGANCEAHFPIQTIPPLHSTHIKAAAGIGSSLNGNIAVAMEIGLPIASGRITVIIGAFRLKQLVSEEGIFTMLADDIETLIGIVVQCVAVGESVAVRIEIVDAK